MKGEDISSLINISLLAISFMFIFSAFGAAQIATPSVLASIRKESGGTFTADGFTSLCIIYIVAFGCHFLGPVISAFLGLKCSMISAGLFYSFYIIAFLKPMKWSLYAGSVLVGISTPIIWNAQATFLILNSQPGTLTRNIGIFGAVFHLSGIFGNIYSHVTLEGSATITPEGRTRLYTGLSCSAILGVLCLLLVRHRVRPTTESSKENTLVFEDYSPWEIFKKTVRMLKTRPILLLSIMYAYHGFEVSFCGIYATCLANNMWFGIESKGMIGLAGILFSSGFIIGAVVFGVFGKRIIVQDRYPVVIFGFVIHLLAYFIIYHSLPDTCPIHESKDPAYMHSNKHLAVACSLMLGLGASCYITQIQSLIGTLYRENSSPGFSAATTFVTAAISFAFFYIKHVGLHIQLLIMIVTGAAGVVSFIMVERESGKGHSQELTVTVTTR